MSLRALAAYFLLLGTVGFGGPIALVGYMQRDLVERRGWFTDAEYREGLALAQLAPGPLAAQLAIYLGWLRGGVRGATAVGVAFILPSFLMVLALSALYVRVGELPWMRGLFYGIAAAVIAVIARSALKLMRLTLRRDQLLWAICIANAALTVVAEAEIVLVFVASGVVVMAARSLPRRTAAGPVLAWGLPPWLVMGLAGAAPASVLGQLAWFFAKAGAMVFGSGLAIVPFLHGGVVQGRGWLSEQQFLDAVAVAMITPGPVVITVAFIGFLVAGPLGATAAALGVFAPVYLAVVLLAPSFRRVAANPAVGAFVSGVTAAATGAIAGAAIVLGRRAIVDLPTAVIGLATLGLTTAARRVPEPLVILAAGALGLLLA